MKKLLILTGLISFFALAPITYSQNIEVYFLTNPSSAEMMSMGFASVAHRTDNPTALTFNPAHLGMQSLDHNVAAVSLNYADWLPSIVSGEYVRSLTVAGGINLQKYYPRLPSVSIGLAYTNLRLNTGMYYLVDPHGMIKSHVYDVADQYTISIGADFLVRASAGFTYKDVSSHRTQTVKAGLYDLGFLVDIPVTKIITSASGSPFLKYKNFTPFLDINAGLAKSNMGKDTIVYDAYGKKQVPRYARMGLEYAMGLTYEKNEIKINPLSFSWTIESNDLLASDWYDYNHHGYQSGVGNINFFKELIIGKGNVNTDKLKGWELGFFDMVMIYGGSFTEEENHGGRNFLTSGIGFRMSGLVKTLSLIDDGVLSSNMRNILNHFDVKITSGIVTGKKYYPVMDGMRYYSLDLYWTNW